MSADPIARAQRWQQFAEEDGGLFDMIEAIRMAYFRRAGELNPWETDKLVKLAMADKIADQLRSHIMAIINDGQVAAHAKAHADKMAELPERKRRWI